MRQPIRNIAVLLILLTATLFSSHRVALAENIDPQDIGLKYAWGENIGWVNFVAVTTSWRPFPPIPTMNASGIMIFAVILCLAAIYYSKRLRTRLDSRVA